MSNLGMGVMIGMLFGGNGGEHLEAAKGRRIARASLDGDRLVLRFDDGTAIGLEDDGQSCCESRYMACDDDLASFTGAKLLGAEIADAPSPPTEYGDHEVQFLRVLTDQGIITCETHNEHNGYYGGFHIVVRSMSPEAA